MASRSLYDLHPHMKGLVESWIQACPVKVLVYCTERGPDEQADLYAIGRTADHLASGVARLRALGLSDLADILEKRRPVSGRRKTNAMPGFSFHHPHVYRGHRGALAVDFVPMVSGKPAWSDTALYAQAGEAAERIGLTWSGRWTTFRETAHVQWDEGGKVKTLPLLQGAYA